MGTYPYAVHLDSKVELSGSYHAGNDETTWTLPIADETIDRIVLSDSFGATAGNVVTPSSVSGTSVIASGDYSAGSCILGRRFDFRLEMSRLYQRDDSGRIILSNRVRVQNMLVEHVDSGAYTLTATLPNRSNQTKVFNPTAIEETGQTKVWFSGNAKDMTIFITNNTPKPCTIVGIDFAIEYAPGMEN